MADDVQTPPNQPERKTFNLKPIASQLIQAELQRHSVMLSSILNFIAIEYLTWPVSELTGYEISPDLKELIIWQNEPELAEGEAEPTQPKEESPTAKALKGSK